LLLCVTFLIQLTDTNVKKPIMPMNNKKLPAHIRQVKIRELLKDSHHVSIPQLAVRFGTSEMTARRDLEKLESQGRIKRTRGGAIAAERMEFEFDFAMRRQAHRKEKQASAKEAYKLIEPRQRLILDTGTTTLELAYLLKDCEDIMVITPSLAVASVLQFSPGVQTVLLGGIIRRGSPDLTGIVTEANLEMFSVDIAFQGADGIGADGTIYTGDMRIVNVDQRIRKRAAKSYILSDSSKIGKIALATNGFIYNAQALITDDKIERAQCEAFQEAGATVIIVDSYK